MALAAAQTGMKTTTDTRVAVTAYLDISTDERTGRSAYRASFKHKGKSYQMLLNDGQASLSIAQLNDLFSENKGQPITINLRVVLPN